MCLLACCKEVTRLQEQMAPPLAGSHVLCLCDDLSYGVERTEARCITLPRPQLCMHLVRLPSMSRTEKMGMHNTLGGNSVDYLQSSSRPLASCCQQSSSQRSKRGQSADLACSGLVCITRRSLESCFAFANGRVGSTGVLRRPVGCMFCHSLQEAALVLPQ